LCSGSRSRSSIQSVGQIHLPTLVIDANATAARELANQLTHSGFAADVAHSCAAARAARLHKYYGSIVFVGDLSESDALESIAELRRRWSRTWIIVISSSAPPDAQQLVFRCGADALLIAPFSMADLTSRLFAFSLRSRPP
jgi:DNA-binding response OmpR family regulator